MAIQTINLGTYANDGTGDDLRTAFQKVNANILELASTSYGANIGSLPPTSGVEEGELWWSTVEGRMYIKYGTAWVESSPIPATISDISNHDLSGLGDVSNATPVAGQSLVWSGTEWTPDSPTISENIDLNGYSIVSSSSFGINSNGGGIGILAINPSNKNYNSIYLNGLELSGGNDETGGEVALTAFTGINLAITSDSGLSLFTVNEMTLTGNQITVIGPITSSSNITTTDSVYASTLFGNLTGDTTGLHTGNVIGNVTGNVTGDVTGTTTGTHIGNVVGNTTGTHTGNVTGDVVGNVTGNVTGTLDGDVNGALVGDIYASDGNTKILENGNGAGIRATFTGNVTGNVTGDVTGTVSDISNHTISELDDVLSTLPTLGQALVWNGTFWAPGTVAAGGGSLDFGTFAAPAGFTLDLGTF